MTPFEHANPSSPVTVRPAAPGDLEALNRHLAIGAAGKHVERLGLQRRDEGVYLVAWLEGLPIGHALLRFSGSGSEPMASRLTGCADIEDLLVREDYRGRGVGSMLLAEAEQAARRRGLTRIGLSVGTDGPARPLYHRRGYRDAGLGEFVLGGSFEGFDGRTETWCEACVYLVKQL